MSDLAPPFCPRNLRWRNALLRLAIVNEMLVMVGAVSMHAGGILGQQTQAEPGFLYQVVWMHFVGWSGMLVMATSALWWVRRAWRLMPDPVQRYERSGAYPGLSKTDRRGLAVITVVGVLVAAYLGRSLLALCLPWLALAGPAPMPPYELAVFNTAYGGLAIYAFEFFRDRAIWSRHREERARQLGAQAQLDLLRAQLEPHMLFNTLANVNDLIDEDPAQAKAMLQRLNTFLRATLQSSRVVLHPLSAEFQLVGDYLALMQIRMADRLKVELQCPPELAELPVPAMLLQPLVENAIQHGLAPRRAGGFVRITAERQGDRLRLEVCNSGAQPQAATQGSGLGLRLVADRLRALYGDRADVALQHVEDKDLTLVRIQLPCPHTP
jgi:signal transduction histidine kinase